MHSHNGGQCIRRGPYCNCFFISIITRAFQILLMTMLQTIRPVQQNMRVTLYAGVYTYT
jgi:hypothetical protein